jgi:endonuclease/exonuclease/phosphatase family metal-dependent hydrolase
MSSAITVATWNIGGGILGKSHQVDGRPQIGYHAEFIRKYKPDILCLQEAHFYPDDGASQVSQIANLAGYEYSQCTPISPSHLEKNAELSLGLISRFPIDQLEYTQFENPELSSTGPNGEKWTLFDKGFTRAQVTPPDSHIYILNAHCFPLHYFGASATDPQFRTLYASLDDDLIRADSDLPTIASIDLNSPEIDEVLPRALSGRQALHVAFRNEPTTPKGVQQDFLLVGRRASIVRFEIVPNNADHYYCSVRLTIN